jgi:hypothetical protein
MIRTVTGDLLKADVQALVNPVNTVGVMGRGLALQFKRAFPNNFRAYAAACTAREVVPGRMFIFETGRPTNPKFIVNFPTKRHWRNKSRLEDIDAGLGALVSDVARLGIGSGSARSQSRRSAAGSAASPGARCAHTSTGPSPSTTRSTSTSTSRHLPKHAMTAGRPGDEQAQATRQESRSTAATI